MAHIQKRSTGTGDTYRVLFRIDGRQRSMTFATMAHAARFSELIERYGPLDAIALIEAADRSSTAPTLTEVARELLKRLAGEVTPGTIRDYERIVDNRIATQAIGELPVDLVTREHVTAWLAYLEADGLGSKTRRNHQALMSAVFSYAVEHRPPLRADNPARGIRIKRTEAVRVGSFLTPGEVELLTTTIDARYRPLVVTLVGTGLRWGEATALTVGDLDLDAPVALLRVTKAYKRTGMGRTDVVGPPKTDAGVRTISLPPEVVHVLRPLVDGKRSDELVFTAPRGGPIRHDKFFTYAWRPMLDQLTADKDADGNAIRPAMVKRPRIHDLRHAHGSQLVAAGVPLNVVQKRLGHESIKTTADVYGHLAPDYLEVSAAAASLLLRKAVPMPAALAIEG